MRDAWPKPQPTLPPSPSPFFALTVAAALSVHLPQQRQGIVMGATQPPVVVTDIVTPVLAGVILGQSLYGARIGAVVAIALVGAVIARSLLPAIDPETSAAGG
jgi:MFS transporter, DHA1 family, tetracycline resistance protein